MKFTKSTAAKYGRRGGLACAAKRQAHVARVKEDKRREQEGAYYQYFAHSITGWFNGFEMASAFLSRVSKSEALIVDVSDDSSMCRGVNVGADGVTVYFFCDPREVGRFVEFNRSVYCFPKGTGIPHWTEPW